jgi:hypothetical protein
MKCKTEVSINKWDHIGWMSFIKDAGEDTSWAPYS